MIPVMLDPREVSVAVVGRGPALVKRVRQLGDGGAQDLTVYSLEADLDLRDAAGARLIERPPVGDDFADVSLVYFAGLDLDIVGPLAELARQHRALVNVEDVSSLCDFHVPGVIRRGDLLLTVSTGGKSPGLARRLRQALEADFGSEWEGRLDSLGRARREWLGEGLDMPTVAARTNSMIDKQGWLE